jgi:cytochrome oxidase Cu insertion factor (SCO1/SenC/PrrC family)
MGSPAQLKAVWHLYGITVDPSSGDIAHSLVLYLIDRSGDQRTAYLYPFLPAFVQGDLAGLARGQA